MVWIVQPAPPPQPTADQARATLHQSTAGSFGRPASETGQTAGSYGQSASTLGRPINAGTASEVGQTAGSFGQSLSTIASAGDAASTLQFEPASLSQGGEALEARLHTAFPGLGVKVLSVSAIDLRDRLTSTPPGEAPDVLLSSAPMTGQNAFLHDTTLADLGQPFLNRVFRSKGTDPAPLRDWLITSNARHPLQARALIVWLRDSLRVRVQPLPWGTPPNGLRSMAIAAADALLQGQHIPRADPTLVDYVPSVAQRMALRSPFDDVLTGLAVTSDILMQASNERFAVFALRAVVSSPRAFGVVYPMVVLRRGDNGLWTVLHVTADLPLEEPDAGAAGLWTYTHPVALERVRKIIGVTQAAPPDGDIRTGMPELWWDNAGDASLLVVEWQRDRGDAHLFYVGDGGPRLQVRISAEFANVPGQYRWRVWSMGAGGAMSLSPWRRLTVLP